MELSKSPYDDERVASDIGYPDGFRDRTADEQITSLREIFPELTIEDSEVNRIVDACIQPFLVDAESKKVMHDYREVAKLSGVNMKGMSEIEVYSLATQVAVDRLKKLHGKKFHNYLEGDLTPKRIQLMQKTSSAHSTLRQKQGKLWVVDSQFGKRWAGASVRHAQVHFVGNEFGWGVYGVTSQLLTHHNRIVGIDQLYIDCAGVACRPSVFGNVFACLNFCWNYFTDRFELTFSRVDSSDKRWCSTSGFLPYAIAEG